MNQEAPDFLADSKLIYVSDEETGYVRVKQGRGFSYRNAKGAIIRDPKELARLKALAIPPAWTDVWICPKRNGHILATGRDDNGRKQYIYHPRWNQLTSEQKFSQLKDFGSCLPTIRKQTESHLRKQKLTREKVLAVVVRLLEKSLIRIGNEAYTRHNDSYGLTTLQDEHVKITGRRISFEFRGKSGKDHEIDLEDKRLAALVKACRDVPGQHLFQYYDADGQPHPVGSGDVNAYLREITGEDFTSKHFRTWGASTYMIEVLYNTELPETETKANRVVVDAVKQAAEYLGNTPAVVRGYYIHPAVIDAFLEGRLQKVVNEQPDSSHDLDRFESALMKLMS
jgi:DNA topoisomerase I